MPNKINSIDELPSHRSLDEVLNSTGSNEGQMQTLMTFMENVTHFHDVLRAALLHKNAILSPMAEQEVMEAARLNLSLRSIAFSNFDTLLSLEDERLWIPPTRVMQALERGINAKKKVSTDYFHRNLLVTEPEIDADMKDFDVLPDISSSTEVALRCATISTVEDTLGSSQYLRKDFVLHALKQMRDLELFTVSHNFSLRSLPTTLMQAVGDTLKEVDLSFNQLTYIPYELLYRGHSGSAAFPNLEVLLLNNNRIRPRIPNELFRKDFAPMLRHLNVENNCLVGFTSQLTNAVYRKTLLRLECCNNDFPDEDADLHDMAMCIQRASMVHHELLRPYEHLSSDLKEDVISARFPVCVAAMHTFEGLVGEYYALLEAGKQWEANLMCPRCGVCDDILPPLWRGFESKFLKPVNEEPSFFDDDSQLEPKCSIVDIAVTTAAVGYWVRRIIEERQMDPGAALTLPTDTETRSLPPVAMFKVHEVLGNLNVPLLFHTCGKASCTDEVVDVVGGEGEGFADYRSLRYNVDSATQSEDPSDVEEL